MAKQIRKHLGTLEYLYKLDDEERKEQLKDLKGDPLKFLFNILLNVVYKKVSVSNDVKLALHPHKNIIQELIKKHKSMKSRKAELIKNDNFRILFGILLPELRKIAL